MVRIKNLLLLVWLALSLPLTGDAADSSTNAAHTAPKVRLDLADGSRIIGTTDLASLPLHSESIGDLKIPLQRIANLKFHSDQKPATITLTNGDRLEGRLQLRDIPVVTLFGTVRIPLEQVRAVQVGSDRGGHAIQLRAANRNYIEIPASNDFDVTESWTLEFWANITGGNGEIIAPVSRIGDDCGHQNSVQTQMAGGRVQFYANDADGGGPWVTAEMNLIDGRWHHWAAVVRDGHLQFYIDGVRVGSQPYKAGATGSRCPLQFGYRATHGGCFIDGTLAEIRLSRVARYDRDFTPAVSYALDADTIAYWRFNEGTGETVQDETGKHPGVLRGSPPPKWVDGVTPP